MPRATSATMGNTQSQRDQLSQHLQEVLEVAMEIQAADLGDIRLYNRNTSEFEIIAHRGVGEDFLRYFGGVKCREGSACDRALRHGSRVLIEDVYDDEEYIPHRNIAASSGYRGVLSIPLIDHSRGESLGCLSTMFHDPYHPSDRQLRIADLHARHASYVIISHITEQRLRDSEARLAAILNQVPGAVALFDTEGQLVMRGGPLSYMWGDLMPSDDPQPALRWKGFDANGSAIPRSQYPGARALRGEVVTPGIDFIRPEDAGGHHWIRVSAAPFRDEMGVVRGAVAILQDVDEDRRADQRLRESQARLQAAVDLAHLGLYCWNPRTNDLEWDAAVKEMWGLPPGVPAEYELWRSAIHPDDLARVEAAVAQCSDPRGDGLFDVDYRVIGINDGVERWIATRGQIEFQNGAPAQLYGVAVDITDQKKTENLLETRVEERTRELEQANKKLIAEEKKRRRIAERLELLQNELFHASRLSVAGQMAAMIAHELSQPLTATLNSVNTARRQLSAASTGRDMELRELIEDTAKQVERASEIIRRLRIYTRRGSVDRVSEAVQPMIEEAVAFASMGSSANDVRISYYFDPTAPSTHVDRVQIQQVISNLVRNALESMEECRRRELTVTTTRLSDQMMEVGIADTGCGVALELRDDLFEPFNTTKPNGMGLGLSICQSIIEAHGGKIRYEELPNGGSLFRFTLHIENLESESQ